MNPILEKDLFRRAKGWLFVVRAAVVGALALGFLLVLSQAGGKADQAAEVRNVARSILAMGLPLFFAYLCGRSFSQAQGLMQREWARHTIIDLGATPLFPRQVVYGKAAAAAWQALATAAGVLPFAAILAALSGTPPLTLLYYLLLAVLGAALFSLLGVLAAAAPPTKRFLQTGQFVSVVVYAALIIVAFPPLTRASIPILTAVPDPVTAALPPWLAASVAAQMVGRQALPMPTAAVALAGLIEPLLLVALLTADSCTRRSS